MIVFDLKCTPLGHVFEAWFASSAAYEDQRVRGLLTCPLCGADAVGKAVMAPNISAKSNSRPDGTASLALAAPADSEAARIKTMLSELARAQAALLEKSDWVGKDFADKARAMHLGETAPRAIHGQATLAEAKAMADEGVGIAALPFPVTPPDAIN